MALPETYQIMGKEVRVSEPYPRDGGSSIDITMAESSNPRDNYKAMQTLLKALSDAGITCHPSPRGIPLASLEIDVNITARLGNARNRDFNADSVVELVHTTLETLQQTKGNTMSKKDYTIAGNPVTIGDAYEANGAQVIDARIQETRGVRENEITIRRMNNALAKAGLSVSVITEKDNQAGVQVDLTNSLKHAQRNVPDTTIENLVEKAHTALAQEQKIGEELGARGTAGIGGR